MCVALAFEWDEKRWASDYFDTMYDAAVQPIKKGKAYVCELTAEQMKEYRGTLTEPGMRVRIEIEQPCENLALLEDKKAGKYGDGEAVLRAKIDMSSPNIMRILLFIESHMPLITTPVINGVYILCMISLIRLKMRLKGFHIPSVRSRVQGSQTTIRLGTYRSWSFGTHKS